MHDANIDLGKEVNELAKLAEKKLNFKVLSKSNILRRFIRTIEKGRK